MGRRAPGLRPGRRLHRRRAATRIRLRPTGRRAATLGGPRGSRLIGRPGRCRCRFRGFFLGCLRRQRTARGYGNGRLFLPAKQIIPAGQQHDGRRDQHAQFDVLTHDEPPSVSDESISIHVARWDASMHAGAVGSCAARREIFVPRTLLHLAARESKCEVSAGQADNPVYPPHFDDPALRPRNRAKKGARRSSRRAPIHSHVRLSGEPADPSFSQNHAPGRPSSFHVRLRTTPCPPRAFLRRPVPWPNRDKAERARSPRRSR